MISSLFFTNISCYVWKNELIFLLTKYLLYNMVSHRFIFTELTQLLSLYIKFSLVFTLFINLPFMFLHILYFMLPSLYRHQWTNALLFFFFSFFSYNLSLCLTYKAVFPFFIDLFLNFEKNNLYFPLHFEAKIDTFFSCMFLIFFFIQICFQIPVFIFFLIFFKILKINFFLNYRIFFFFLMLFISAIIAPPEIFIQLFILFLLIIFYECFFFISILFFF